MSRLVLVGGGARSGKSAFAVRRALGLGARRAFVATAEAFDDEMRARIAAHVAERGGAFRTIEAPRELDAVMADLCAARGALDVAVVDCLTLWLSNLLLGGVTDAEIERRVDGLARAFEASPFPVLVVTNEVGFGLVPETSLGRRFRDIAGRAHQRLSASAGEVWLAVLGCVLRIKPAPIAVEEGGP